jgi:hypothetical protein
MVGLIKVVDRWIGRSVGRSAVLFVDMMELAATVEDGRETNSQQ